MVISIHMQVLEDCAQTHGYLNTHAGVDNTWLSQYTCRCWKIVHKHMVISIHMQVLITHGYLNTHAGVGRVCTKLLKCRPNRSGLARSQAAWVARDMPYVLCWHTQPSGNLIYLICVVCSRWTTPLMREVHVLAHVPRTSSS